MFSFIKAIEMGQIECGRIKKKPINLLIIIL